MIQSRCGEYGWAASSDEFGGDDHEIVGDDAPAQPTFEAGVAPIETAIQPAGAAQAADPAFNPGAEAQRRFAACSAVAERSCLSWRLRIPQRLTPPAA